MFYMLNKIADCAENVVRNFAPQGAGVFPGGDAAHLSGLPARARVRTTIRWNSAVWDSCNI
ncbi:hypothetical protein FMK89_26110 [Klebsiella grimontii]|nr:hypothetical protein [Klebsiella grimontii]MBZ7384528.1 hypothetical protein [Klebsiella grimontii]